MNNPTPTPDQDPAPGNVPAQNPIIAETPPQVYTAPHIDNPPPKKPFMFSKILLPIVIIMVLLATTAGTYLALNSKPKPQPTVSKVTPTSTPTPAPVDETANWKTYENKVFGLSFKFPPTLAIQDEFAQKESLQINLEENKLGPPRMTIVFFTGHYAEDGQSDLNIILTTKKLNDFVYSKIESHKIDSQTIYSFSEDFDNTSGKIPPVGGPLNQLRAQGTVGEFFLDIFYPYGENVQDDQNVFNQILSTFKFTEISPTPTCRPRPACLDATPRCLIPETSDMCRPSATPPPGDGIVCTQEAKLCPDGKTYVGRQGPKCEFAACPGQ